MADVSPSEPVREPFPAVLFAEPTYFDVEYVINAHMVGQVGTVDRDAAYKQWESVVEAYRQIGYRIEILPGVEGLPDLCFIANQSLPIMRADGSKAAIMSNMANPQRRAEVPVVEAWFKARGWETLHIPDPEVHFEGTGDAIWHPRRRLVWGGHGFRTHHTAYVRRSHLVQAEVIPLELHDLRFYHLDTCFAPLDENTALIVEEAFTEAGLASLKVGFDRLISCPVDEAEQFLACNGHCPDGKHFIVDRGSVKTMKLVADAGFEPVGVDTSEFRKSGGSVQCLKLMVA